ncbi:MAG: hypothetical protein AABX02_01495, partial [archaeon]
MDLLPRILIGCPTADVKADSLEAYVAGLNALTYPNVDIVIEDNSANEKYAERIQAHAKEWEKNHPGHTFRVNHSGNVSPRVRERIIHGRNVIRDIVLKENYDYFFSLEQDIIPQKDVIEKLLAHRKDVVGGVYYNKVQLGGKMQLVPLLMIYPNEQMKQKNQAHWVGFTHLVPPRLIEVASIGLGCVLIHRSVLEKISFRIRENDPAFDDMHFAIDLRQHGISMFAD